MKKALAISFLSIIVFFGTSINKVYSTYYIYHCAVLVFCEGSSISCGGTDECVKGSDSVTCDGVKSSC